MAVTIRLNAEGGDKVAESFRKIAQSAEQMGGKFQALKAQAEGLRGIGQIGLNAFGEGKDAGIFGMFERIRSAGGIKNYIGLAGGGIMGGAIAGAQAVGVVAQKIEEYDNLSKAAERAGISARQLDGARTIFQGLGVEAKNTDQILGTFADKMEEARRAGGPLAEALKGVGVEIRNADGSARPSIAVFQDLTAKLKETTDEDERLKLATAAVGAELAGPLVTAVSASTNGLRDLSVQAQAAGSALAGPAADGARALTREIDRVSLAAQGAYAQLKQLAGLSDKDNDVIAARARAQASTLEAERNRRLAITYDPEGVSEQATNRARRRQGLPEFSREYYEQQAQAAEFSAMRERFKLGDLQGERPQDKKIKEAYEAQQKRLEEEKEKARLAGSDLSGAPGDSFEGGDRGGRSGRAAAEASEEERSAYERVRAELERMQQQLGMTAREKFQYQQEQKLGAESSESEKAAIRAQAGAYYDLQLAIADANKQKGEFNETLKTTAGTLGMAAIQGKNMSDTLNRLGAQAANRALMALLDSLLKGFSLPGLAGILGPGGAPGAPMQLQGSRAGGGTMRAGGGYLVGERGEEWVFPKTDSTVIPNGGIGGAPKINVNTYNNASGAKAETRASQQPDGSYLIETTVKDVIMQDMAKNGDITQAWSNMFGMKRGGGA